MKITVYEENKMYTLLKAMGRRVNESAIIDQFDATGISLLKISQLYYNVYFIIKVDIYSTPRVIYYTDLPLEVQFSHLTIVDYLTSLKNKTIDYLMTDIPVHVRGEVYAWDLFSWDFECKSIKVGYHDNARLTDEDRTDLRISKKGLDNVYLGKHCMVSINGLFHYHEYSDRGIIVVDGNVTKQKRMDSTHISILDFTQVGEVKLKRITEKMIRQPNDGSTLKDNVYIDIGESSSKKTVGIVIGGYFHLLDHTYKHVSDRVIKIDFNNIKWESLYYKMKDIIDISNLPMTDYHDDRVIGFELYHDKTIKALFTLPQSFIVIIDNPNVAVQEEQIGHMGIPQRYESAIKPIYPLRIAEGRYVGYKAIKEYDKWVICVDDNIVPLQVRYQRPEDKFNITHNRIYPLNGEVYATAHYVRIYSDRDLKTRLLDTYFEGMGHNLGSLKPYMLHDLRDDLRYDGDNDPISEYHSPEKLIDLDFDNDPYYKTPVDKLVYGE